ncbi:nuclear pore complex protein Nup93-1-like [Drosophila innubila]|uniref:nuclear pore complex protein Nup93-1-like n=1 Tax=Drosophila innubila TaxID=198719 RepID=UPI00148E697F|nr:nuclear pore complex protein Nup93-1-like [Drosophila innubila]
MSCSLSELLQQAQRLANEAKLIVTHSPVERTLYEVLRETEEMHSRLTGKLTQPEENTRQARMMFGQKGIDLQLLMDKIEKLDMGSSFKPSDAHWDPDVAGFLKTKLQNVILDVIEDTNSNIFQTVEKRKWRSLFSEWEMEKGMLINSLSECDEKTTPQTSLNCTEMLYAKELISYNKLQNRRENLLIVLTQLAEMKIKNSEITEMWRLLKHMAKQTPLCLNKDAVRTRQGSPQFLGQSRLYLELAYRDHMTKVIQQSRNVSKCGGIPNIYSKVKSFVSIKFQQTQSLSDLSDIVLGCPLWPLVFYSLRCGDPEAAVQNSTSSRTIQIFACKICSL